MKTSANQQECVLCLSKIKKTLYKFEGFEIFKCANCNLVYVKLFRSKINDNLYDDDYGRKIYMGFRPEGDSRYIEKVLGEIREIKGEGKLLDIGCGSGKFLISASKSGYEVYGVEISKKLADNAKRLELDIYNNNIERLNFSSESFDVITMWDVLEHVENPIDVLKKIRGWLKKDGILCIEVPNFGSIFRKLTQKKWIGFIEYHLFHFDVWTLQKLLKRTNFEIVRLRTDNVNFFSKEGLQRLRLYGWVYDAKLVLAKVKDKVLRLSDKNISQSETIKNENKFRHLFSKAINYPLNKFFNYFNLGDQIRIYAKK